MGVIHVFTWNVAGRVHEQSGCVQWSVQYVICRSEGGHQMWQRNLFVSV